MKRLLQYILPAMFLFAAFIGGAIVGRDRVCFRRGMPHMMFPPGMAAELNLSSEQKQKVEEILKAQRSRLQALRDETRPKFEEVRAATERELNAVLTDSQREQFKSLQKQLRAERRQKWVERMGGGDHGWGGRRGDIEQGSGPGEFGGPGERR